ncbi:MAG TPA: hypothetical protein VIN08_13950 [Ohtaekwangia sp.]|uniref:hypothetical protein n=1 Tax=Ohtaekwangia sp. TaxID=2066019 RepID=UPI002F92AE4B
MNFVQQLLLYISITAFIFLLIGLYKPWIMLWWEDVQNRRKIFKLYGGISVISYVLYWLLILFI